MKKGIKIARLCQLAGAAVLVVAIARCSAGALTDSPGSTGALIVLGLLLIVGGKTYEFLTKE